jgi:hypothetical protein
MQLRKTKLYIINSDQISTNGEKLDLNELSNAVQKVA